MNNPYITNKRQDIFRVLLQCITTRTHESYEKRRNRLIYDYFFVLRKCYINKIQN